MQRRILVAALAAVAAQAVAEELPMEHVLVSVPLHKTEAETSMPITVLSGEELQRLASSSIGDTLRDQPGIANASFGPGVGRPVLRGQTGPRTLNLQNGTASADASSLSPDHAVTVEPFLTESVEVLRGPATLLYGGGAIGGVVNVIDNRIPRSVPDGVTGGAEYRHDTATGLDSLTGKVEGGAGNLAFHLSANTLESDDVEIPGNAMRFPEEEDEHGHEDEHDEEHEDEHGAESAGRGEIPNTETESDSVTLGFSVHFGDNGYAGLAVNHQEREYGIPPGAHGHHDDEDEHHDGDEEEAHHDEEEHAGEEENIRIDLEQTRYDAQLHLHDLGGAIDVFRGFLTYTDYEHKELEGAETGTVYDRETWETRLEAVHRPIGNAHGVFGLLWREDDFEAIGEEAYVPPTESSEIGLFIVEDIHAGNWLFELGLRGDRVDRDPAGGLDSKDFTAVSVSGSALWSMDDNWQLGVSLSRSERAPSTEELYSNADIDDPGEFVTHAATGLIEIGDPDLDEEVSANVDISLSYFTEDISAELTLFYNNFEDYIYLFNTGTEIDETAVYAYGQEDTVFTGVEFSGEYTLFALAGGEVSLGLRGDLIRGRFDDAGHVPRLPPSRFGGKVQWASDSLATWVDVQWAADQDRPGRLEEASRGYTRVDVGADYTLGLGADSDLTVFLRGKNLTDEEIRVSTSFLRDFAPEPGRSLEAGVRVRVTF